MNKFEIKSPIFRHSDLKIIGKQVNICKSNDYYYNNTRNLKKNFKEFRSKKYSLIDHDHKVFFSNKKKKFFSRSDILSSIIKIKIKNKNCKILDFGCHRGSLLIKLSKMGYNNLYGYDLGNYYTNFFSKRNIKFIKNLSQKKKFFDFIIFSHSSGYSENIEKLLVLIKKISKKKSIFFFNIQDIKKRPFNFILGDQKYHFNKIMVKNLNEELLSHELLFFFKFKRKSNNKKININSNEITKARNLINRIRKIKNACDVLGENLGSALSIAILKKKVKNIVTEHKKSKNYFLKKKIISINEHKKNNIPLLINFANENNLIISRLKNKFKLKKIIQIS